MVSKSGITSTDSPSARSRPASRSSTPTSSRSDTDSQCEMMYFDTAARPKRCCARLAAANDRQLLVGQFASTRRCGNAQRARTGELARENVGSAAFFHRRVIGLDAGAPQQLVHHRGMLVRALAQVDRREVEAEHAELAPQRAQAARGERAGALGFQALRDGVEVARELGGRGVRRELGHRRRSGRELGERARRRGEAAVDSRHRAPVGLVLPVRRGIARALGELEHRTRRRPHQAPRQPELASEEVRLVEVMGEDHARLLRALRSRAFARRHSGCRRGRRRPRCRSIRNGGSHGSRARPSGARSACSRSS